MARATLHSAAIVLDKVALAEKDLIVTLLGQDGSQIRAVAKGARRPGGKLAGRCELFSEVDLLLAQGKNLHIITEAALLDSHPTLMGDFEKSCCAGALCDVASKTCFEDAPDPYLYPLLARALKAVEEAQSRSSLDVVAAAYCMKVLGHSGWMPQLENCVICGEPDVTRLAVHMGGALCVSCAHDMEGAEPASPTQLSLLSSLITSTFDELLATSFVPEDAVWLLGVAHSWAATHLDTRLKAMEMMLII